MTEYWIISAPGEKTCLQTWDTLNNVTSKQHLLSENFKFHLPDLKVGTLDQLVGLSDDLGKLDSYVEAVTRKLTTYLGDILEENRSNLAENLKVNGADLGNYLTRFQWDMAKYPVKQSLKNITEIISKQVTQIDTDLKAKSSAYNTLKSTLQTLERKSTGSLLVCSLADIVKKEHLILGSEYLSTLVVVVPKSMYKEWNLTFEKLTDMVVPRSSQLIHEDQEHGLFTVTLFQKVVDEFKLHARENKFVVRDFQYNEMELAQGKHEMAKLESDKKKQYGLLIRWLKVNFSEVFVAWIHVKALRVFVESVLRYGLPVNFQAMLLHPTKKSMKKLREVLNDLYSHLDSSLAQGPIDDIPGLNMGQSEYFPYVYFQLNMDIAEAASHRL